MSDFKNRRLTKELLDEVRLIDGFPIGKDEDIIALSDPPYYTACPNPFIEDFIKEHGKPYETETDNYHRKPYAADVNEGKQDPVCMAHTYHTKVPYRAIVRYIMNYTNPGDIILDCFGGTGMTGVAAHACASPPINLKKSIEKQWESLGRDAPNWGIRYAIIIDLSPFASFLSRNFNSNMSFKQFTNQANKLIIETEEKCKWLYRTDNPLNSRLGDFVYGLWSDVLFCECGEEVRLYDPFNNSYPVKFKTELYCPKCGAKVTKKTSDRAISTIWDDKLQRSIKQNKQDLVIIKARFDDKLVDKEPSSFDERLISKIFDFPFPLNAPTYPMMFKGQRWGEMFRSGIHFGISHVHHFWTKRNIIALSEMFKNARNGPNPHEMMFLCTSFAVKTGSRMHNVGFKDGKINLAGQTYNTLQFPSVSAERNIFDLARTKIRYLNAVFQIPKVPDAIINSTQSATSLKQIPQNSIDYIFIDPPFGENIIYSELNFLYESWLNVFTKLDYEAIISKKQGKNIVDYKKLMLGSFQELYRVLKPDRWITVVFHNSKNLVWNAIQESLGNAGFVISDVRVLDKGQGTFKQMTTSGAVKHDLVISAYKPNTDLVNQFNLESSSEENIWIFIRQHLRHLPVYVENNGIVEILNERLNYLLYDRMVAFHVQRGITVPISSSEFYAGLKQRFPQRDGMYFAVDQLNDYDRKRMEAKRIEQASLFVHDERSAIQWLRRELSREPQTYQDIQPQFLQELYKEKHEDLPELSEILEQNFLQDDEGKWYIPDSGREADLEKLREKTLLREFKEYKDARGRLRLFRSEAVRTGFSKCWQEGDYETIVEVAEKLPINVLQEEPTLLMYYDNAIILTQE